MSGVRIPDSPPVLRGYSSVGRALAWHARGQRFDPAYLHQIKKTLFKTRSFLYLLALSWINSRTYIPSNQFSKYQIQKTDWPHTTLSVHNVIVHNVITFPLFSRGCHDAIILAASYIVVLTCFVLYEVMDAF